jgi:putative transposase
MEVDWLHKKGLSRWSNGGHRLIRPTRTQLSMTRPCGLVGLARSSWYDEPRVATAETLAVMRLLDERHTKTPFYGVERMTAWLRQQGREINPQRVRRLLRLMGLEALYPKPRTSMPVPGARRSPSLLRGRTIRQNNDVWSTDITYIRMQQGFLYLVAVLDWYSRSVRSWHLSNTLDTGCCLEALDAALRWGQPQLFNSDQGGQFTSVASTSRLEQAGIQISWDGRGRAPDTAFVERLWRSVKWEAVDLKEYRTGAEAASGLDR